MLPRVITLLLLALSFFSACHGIEQFTFPLEDLLNSNQQVSHKLGQMAIEGSPTMEPTAAPSKEPTAAPTYSPNEFMTFTATLRLFDATSNVLDETAVNILTESVATATGVQNSEVTLESYIAVRITSSTSHTQERVHNPVFRIRDGETKRLRTQLSQQRQGSSVFSLFQSGIMQRGASTLSDVQYYKISAVLRITAKLADYPAYNNDVDALYSALSTALTTAVADNTLQTQIVSASIAADSATFASISAIETVAISPPVVEDPSAAQDNNSSESYEPGEVAGMVIAVMVGLGIAIFIVFKLCCRRKPANPDAYIVFDPIVPEAPSPSPAPAQSGMSDAITVRSAKQVNVTTYEPGEAVGVEW